MSSIKLRVDTRGFLCYNIITMNVNLDRGGIIWQARLHTTTAEHVEPLNRNAGEFHTFASDMFRARQARGDITADQLPDAYRQLELDSEFHPLGRVARHERKLPSGKKIHVNLTVLNESVGIMPRYHLAESDIRKIGRTSFFLHNVDTHTHGRSSVPRHQSRLSSGFDILTDGSVHMTTMTLEICNSCPEVSLHDEAEILNQLGFSALHYARIHPIATSYSNSDPYSRRTSRMMNQRLDDEQQSGLQRFLAEQFTPDSHYPELPR